MAEAELKVELREKQKKSGLKQLRREGKMPGVYYSDGEAAVLITLDLKAFQGLISRRVNIFDLDFGKGKKKPSIIREMQLDPISDDILHVDLYGIKTSEKIAIKVPINLVGTARGAKEMGGVLEHPMREIEIECLPKDVPDGVDLDVSELGINERLRVEDIQLENIVILSDPKSLVAQVVPPKVEVVEEEEVVAEEEELEEPEVITAKEEEAEEE
jgi:large subunit ribosomal protein L25